MLANIFLGIVFFFCGSHLLKTNKLKRELWGIHSVGQLLTPRMRVCVCVYVPMGPRSHKVASTQIQHHGLPSQRLRGRCDQTAGSDGFMQAEIFHSKPGDPQCGEDA